MHGSFAKVLGHPAYVETGTVSSTSPDVVVRVTPWTGKGWAAACQVTVEFDYTLNLAKQFCSDTEPCHAAEAIALGIARRYVAYSAMRQPPMRPLDDDVVPDFFGADIAGGPQAQAVVNASWDFGFSYVNFVLVPLLVDGRLYLGAVGHNGWGWREGPNILVAVYTAPADDQDDLVPLAGFLIERKPSALRGTVVAEGGSAIPMRP